MRVLFSICALAAASACAPAAAPVCTATPDDSAVERVPSEVPGLGRRFWQATNEQARQWGGALTLTAEGERRAVLAFSNGVTLQTERLGACEGAAQAGADNLASLLGTPADVPIQMYRG